jgi:hypothetical protein
MYASMFPQPRALASVRRLQSRSCVLLDRRAASGSHAGPSPGCQTSARFSARSKPMKKKVNIQAGLPVKTKVKAGGSQWG